MNKEGRLINFKQAAYFFGKMKKLISVKYIEDIIKNGMKLEFLDGARHRNSTVNC